MPPTVAAEVRAALAVGTTLTISGIGYASPIGAIWEGYLEGWQHRIAPGRHEITLFTSERVFTEPSDRWQDITPTLRWDQIAADVTWDQTGDMP
jgi:hypothetical protein